MHACMQQASRCRIGRWVGGIAHLGSSRFKQMRRAQSTSSRSRQHCSVDCASGKELCVQAARFATLTRASNSCELLGVAHLLEDEKLRAIVIRWVEEDDEVVTDVRNHLGDGGRAR